MITRACLPPIGTSVARLDNESVDDRQDVSLRSDGQPTETWILSLLPMDPVIHRGGQAHTAGVVLHEENTHTYTLIGIDPT